jgi:hypothetical protein
MKFHSLSFLNVDEILTAILMSAELQSCLVDVNVVSILKRPESEDDDTNKEPSKKHRGASTTAEFGPPESTETHANGGNPNETAPSLAGNLHPKLAKALSQVPYSPLFGILWPLIVEQASFEMRDQLRYVNDYFEALCHRHSRSDRAKSVRHISQFTLSLLISISKDLRLLLRKSL